MRVSLGALTLCLGIMCSCSAAPKPKEQKMKHDNGLTASIPEGTFEVEQTASGFRLRPPNWRSMRSPTEVTLELGSGEPAGDWRDSKRIDDADVRYRIDTLGTGSGGDERVLRAWKKVPEGHIVVQQIAQSEDPSSGEFSAAVRDVLRSARIER